MDNNIFSLAYVVVTFTLFFSIFLYSLYRGELYLKLFTSAFASATISAILLINHDPRSIVYTFIIGHWLYVVANMQIYCGARSYFQDKVFPNRFWSYLIIGAFHPYYFSLSQYHIVARVLVFILFFAIVLSDFYLFLRNHYYEMSPVVKRTLLSVVAINGLMYIGRAVLIIFLQGTKDSLIYNEIVNTYIFIAQTILFILVFIVAILFDAYRLLDKMQEKSNKIETISQTLQIVLDNSMDGIGMRDLNTWEFKYRNKAMIEIGGYTEEEMDAMTLEQKLERVHPDDRDIFLKTQSLMQVELEPEEDNIFRWMSKNGDYRWFSDRQKIAHDVEGQPVALVEILRDITKEKELEEELRKAAIKDKLTGLYNRHYFETMIVDEMERSDRYAEPLAMALLDLDYFKEVNDTWGHQVGDEQLKLVARIIERTTRSSDIAVRMGGEEFLIMMPGTSLHGAREVAEKIRMAIKQNCDPITGVQTVSIGISERMKIESFRHWFRRTDTAMYRAKGVGRDCVIASDEQEGLIESSIRLEWKNEWLSGNSRIDSQHQELVEVANRFINQSITNKGFEDIRFQIDTLLDAISIHFEDEETILKEAVYPDYELHVERHRSLVSKAKRLKESYESGEIKPSAFFSFVMDEMIMDHMIDFDSKFIEHINRSKVD